MCVCDQTYSSNIRIEILIQRLRRSSRLLLPATAPAAPTAPTAALSASPWPIAPFAASLPPQTRAQPNATATVHGHRKPLPRRSLPTVLSKRDSHRDACVVSARARAPDRQAACCRIWQWRSSQTPCSRRLPLLYLSSDPICRS